jgi:hypothetical protein
MRNFRSRCPTCGRETLADREYCRCCSHERGLLREVRLACDRFFLDRGLDFNFNEFCPRPPGLFSSRRVATLAACDQPMLP